MESGKVQASSQKGQQVINFTEDEARAYFERLRWPHALACIHCGSENVYRVGGTAARAGLIECKDCRQQFTVTTNTVMHDTHLPLATWAKAFHLMCSSKKGISALQLQRQLGLGSYRTAWHLAQRIREAMKCEPVAGMLSGTVECDEVYIGGKPRFKNKGKRGPGTDKTPVLVVVERNGRIRRRVMANVTAKNVKGAIREMVSRNATIHTDENLVYYGLANQFAGHETVKHNSGEYVRDGFIHNNTAESSNALLKRGITGAFNHVSKEHLHRYLAEFDFRWDRRHISDAERRDDAVRNADGKRLMYKTPVNPPQLPPLSGEQLPPFPC